MGTKPPYWDMSITGGFCDPCFKIEMEKIEKHYIGRLYSLGKEQKGGEKRS